MNRPADWPDSVGCASVAWLISRMEGGTRVYWNGASTYGPWGGPLQAVRFVRKEDAAHVRYHVLPNEIAATADVGEFAFPDERGRILNIGSRQL